MKTLSKVGVLAALGSALFLSSCAGEYYVSDQPADVVYERPAPPYQGAVWIEGDWVYSGGRYVHSRGHWVRPRSGRTYVAGGWHHTPRGYAWHRGHWLRIKARKVIYATHIPPGINSYSFRCAPYRSYVLGVKLRTDTYPDALIYDMQEPYHYIRTHVIDGEKLLIVGGNDHKTGHHEPEKAFADLEEYVRLHYNVSSIKYRWSSQYYVPVDGFPYIGQMPEAAEGVYCATGYNGNGMMLGSIAGKILSDLAQDKVNRYADIFSPSRLKPIAGFTAFVEENADVVYHMVADRFGIHETDSLKRLAPGTGNLVEVDGKKIAAYRDDQGKIFALNPVCTHAGCIVNWNGEEKSWDCPCHGARYDIYGQVLTGPTVRPLSLINTDNNE